MTLKEFLETLHNISLDEDYEPDEVEIDEEAYQWYLQELGFNN